MARGLVKANVPLTGWPRGVEREVEIDDRALSRAAKGLVTIVWVDDDPDTDDGPADPSAEDDTPPETGEDALLDDEDDALPPPYPPDSYDAPETI